MQDKKTADRAEPFIPWVLVLATALAYGQVCSNGFINYDDPCYVTENRGVQAGLSRAGFRWALTATDCTNWHPLTWLSLQLDYELYQLAPWGYHLTNLLLHLANVVGLFWLLRRMTSAIWRSAAVAAFFALHPVHVESVAWIAERKDVLSTLFWLLTLGAYLHYVARPGLPRYLLVLLTFTLGLMAKPMLVTLPFVLVLLDYWPLGRWPVRDHSPLAAVEADRERRGFRSPRWLILEKLPLLALSAASCAVTLFVQYQVIHATVGFLGDVPLVYRVLNALVAYVRYLWLLFWPRNLALLYPHPGVALPLPYAVGAGLLLVSITVFALKVGRRCPYFPVGWFWYLGTLVPVIGLVQVGYQALADRYTYVPLIGLWIMITWGAYDLVKSWSWGRLLLAPIAGILVVACAIGTWRQVSYWRDSFTLWQHALQVTDKNWMAHYNLGFAYAPENVEEAKSHFAAALQYNPRLAEALDKLGVLLVRQVKLEEAREHFTAALEIKPSYERARQNLANVENYLAKKELLLHHGGKAVEMAERACKATQYHQPEYLQTLAAAYAEVRRFDDAVATARQALAIASQDYKKMELVGKLQTSLRLYEAGLPDLDK